MNDKSELVRVETAGRRVIFYDTDFTNLDPLMQCATQGYVTHVLVALFHLGYDDGTNKSGPYVHLNNVTPDDPTYANLWRTVPSLQSKGVKVMGSLGGGGVGDFGNLFASSQSYTTFYGLLKNMLQKYNLDGLDLDIEESASSVNTQNVSRLVSDLRRDFQGRDGGFLVTSAPVAAALTGQGSMSPNVNYNQLIDQFDFYNLQFYNGWGHLNPAGAQPHYDDVVNKCGLAHVPKLVAGVLTNPSDGGEGYNSLSTLNGILSDLLNMYSNFGGVTGWTYQHALDEQNRVNPFGWARSIWTCLNPQT
jgi:hypothetical protein